MQPTPLGCAERGMNPEQTDGALVLQSPQGKKKTVQGAVLDGGT